MPNHPLLVILGPTACGKTRLAVAVARQIGAEIISADSRQVYRGMDIGTGKDLSEYTTDNQTIKHHLIDIAAAGDSYNVSRFQADCVAAMTDIQYRNKRAILCGGTGFYIESVLKNHQFTALPIDDNLRLDLAQQSTETLQTLFEQTPSAYSPLADISTRKRLIRAIEIGQYLGNNPAPFFPNAAFDFRIVGLDLPVELRRQRITQRLRERLQNGLIEEVEGLLKSGIPADQLIFYGLEYKFITQHLLGEFDHQTLFERLNTAIHQFAKRQMTFFRKMERDGLPIHWLDAQKSTDKLTKEVIGLIGKAETN